MLHSREQRAFGETSKGGITSQAHSVVAKTKRRVPFECQIALDRGCFSQTKVYYSRHYTAVLGYEGGSLANGRRLERLLTSPLFSRLLALSMLVHGDSGHSGCITVVRPAGHDVTPSLVNGKRTYG